MRILRMGEAHGRDSRPETLRGRWFPEMEGVNDDASREHPETPSGKRRMCTLQNGERAASRLVKLKRLPKMEGVNDDASREHPETPSGKGRRYTLQKKKKKRRACSEPVAGSRSS